MQVAYAMKMEKVESPRRLRRRLRLQELLGEFGGAAQVARESGTPKSHFSAMISGSRGLGDGLAAKLEDLYGKPAGWFDENVSASMAEPQTTASLAPLISSQKQPTSTTNTVPAATENATIPIEQLMAGLAHYLMEMDDDARHSAADVLRNLTHKPENHARAAAMFTTAFQLGARKVA